MSNNTRRPPSTRTAVDDSSRIYAEQPTQPPRRPQPAPQPPRKGTTNKRMWLYCGCAALLGFVLLFTGHFFSALFLMWCAVILCPIFETIIRKADDPNSTLVRVLTNRQLRCTLAIIVGIVAIFGALIASSADKHDDVPPGAPTQIVLTASATPTPTAEPTAAPDATPADTPAPTIAAGETMTVEEVVALLDVTIAGTQAQEGMDDIEVSTSFEDDFYNIYFTPDNSVLYAFMLLSEPDNLSADELATMTRDYEALTAEFCTISARAKAIFDENGHSNCHVMVHILNPENTENVLYSSIDGYQAYSVLTGK